MFRNMKIYFDLVLTQIRHPRTKVEYVEFVNGIIVKRVQLPFRKF